MCEFEAGIDYNQLVPGRLIKRPNSRRPKLAKATKKATARKPYTAADVKLLTEEGGEEVQADQFEIVRLPRSFLVEEHLNRLS